MCAYIAATLKAYDSKPVIVGGAKDHVYILCLMSKIHPLSKIVAEVKRDSSKWMKTKGVRYREFSWQGGYGAFSVSKSNVDSVIKYIRDQKEHHKKYDFMGEMVGLLKKHGIEYDERYLD
jgi:REP element-mobilizing transposase RayT